VVRPAAGRKIDDVTYPVAIEVEAFAATFTEASVSSSVTVQSGGHTPAVRWIGNGADTALRSANVARSR
jgi:hypothetical protein